MPRVVPSLEYRQSPPGGCESGDESPCRRFQWENRALLDQMRLYPDPDVVGWLQRQLDAATDPQWRLFLGAELAAHGSAAGRAVVLSTRGTTDSGRAAGQIDALKRVAQLDPPPKWATDALAALAALGVDPDRYSIRRPVTSGPATDEPPTVAAAVRTLRADRDAEAMVRAIDLLATCRTQVAVAGLIDACGSDLKPANVAVAAESPDDLRDRITAALRELTGQPFGWDAGEWRLWWERDGRADTRFK